MPIEIPIYLCQYIYIYIYDISLDVIVAVARNLSMEVHVYVPCIPYRLGAHTPTIILLRFRFDVMRHRFEFDPLSRCAAQIASATEHLKWWWLMIMFKSICRLFGQSSVFCHNAKLELTSTCFPITGNHIMHMWYNSICNSANSLNAHLQYALLTCMDLDPIWFLGPYPPRMTLMWFRFCLVLIRVCSNRPLHQFKAPTFEGFAPEVLLKMNNTFSHIKPQRASICQQMLASTSICYTHSAGQESPKSGGVHIPLLISIFDCRCVFTLSYFLIFSFS